MSRDEKLIAKIRARPVEADYRDVKRLLESFGWVGRQDSSSHVIYRSPAGQKWSVPLKGGKKVKQKYLAQLCELLGLDE